MSSFSRSIQRYLDDKSAKVNILKDEEFKLSRQALISRRSFGHRARHEARQLKFGNVLLKKDEISGEDYLEWFQERET